jgi:hypothetical protein
MEGAMIAKQHRDALAKAREALRGNPDVVSVGIGYKYRAGQRTDETCIVVGVRKKLPAAEVAAGRLVPSSFDSVPTDVIQYGEVKAQALTSRRRPCPPGYSVGHPQVTAGTLGAWVLRGQGPEHYVLSNNHVLANSNGAALGDFIRQPGTADGGTDNDRMARLTEFVRIRFDGDTNGGGKKTAASYAWKAWQAPANFVARLVNCPYRLVVMPQLVDQPYPNLVDAAVAQVTLEEWVDPVVPHVGEIAGIRDLQLGDRVQKTGRSTEHTQGMVEAVDAEVRVDYGPGHGTATFTDQLIVRADAGEFSAPGDSGSAVLSADAFLGGLLFAGGEGITIVNRIANVVSLLGLRI